MKFRCLVMVLLLLGLTACKREQAAPQVKVGSAAPDFTLKDLSGKDVHLSDLKGKVVLVNFWATWCPPCRGEIPSMEKLNKAMAGKPFQMLAISIDDGGKGAVEAFFKETNASLPVLLDPNGATSRMYGTTGVPETFVVDKKGIILDKVVGAMDWNDPKVVQSLQELMSR